MSTTYEIYKFAKPTLKELSIVDYYSDYDVFSILDEDGDNTGEFISLFRIDDKSVSNIVDSRFVRKLELPEFVTDYNRLYEYIGFDKEAIKKKQVHIECSDGWYMDFTDGTKTKSVRIEELDKFKNKVNVKCVAIKMESLWDSDEVFVYPDKKRVLKYIPGIDEYRYVPITNVILSKAEIPFLIFERNKGKCFIQKC